MLRSLSVGLASVAPRRTRAGPLVVGLFALAVATGASLKTALSLTGGHLVYAVDDAYIHLAMARTLAESGVWGISAAQPAFASSSPGWTLLLAGLYVIGLRSEWVPFILNVAGAVLLLVLVDRPARRSLLPSDSGRLWLILAVVFVTPVPALVLSGMETIWFAAAVVAFVAAAARLVGPREHLPDTKDGLVLGCLAVAMVTLRFEGFFVAVAVLILLGWRRRLRTAAILALAAVAPVLVYGAFSMTHGGWWLPTSVVLKAQPPSLTGVVAFGVTHGFPTLLGHGVLALLLFILVGLLLADTWVGRELDGEAEAWMLVVALSTIAHVHLVNIEWFYRYRAYLVATGLAACAFGIARVASLVGATRATVLQPAVRAAVVLLAAAATIGPLIGFAADALARAPRGSAAIYQQQYQIARFLAAEGTGAVALNDIGAVAYFTRRPVVDLAGLADQRIAIARRTSRFDTAGMQAAVARASADVAVLYDSWFEGPLAPPSDWVRVGRWTATEHVTVADPTVSFYATRFEHAAALRASLRAWTPQLPSGVTATVDDAPQQRAR